MPLIVHREACIHEVYNDEKDKEHHDIESYQVVIPRDVQLFEPVTETKYLGAD
jgi:hypothetical protein